MSYESVFAIRTLAINASTWTDIVGEAVLPVPCNTVVIFNSTSVDIALRSDPGNSSSEVTIHPGQQFEIGGAPGGIGSGFNRPARFPQNCQPVCSLKSASGNQNAIVESIL